MGGDIGVGKEAGRPGAFAVTLPASEPGLVAAETSAPATPRVHVLVVDDEPAIGTTLRLLLADEYDVASTTRAREALARVVNGEHFDVILCDLMMPDMSGMELHDEILRIQPALAERMVFLTGGAFTVAARDFIARVPNLRLEKPFSHDTLRELLQAMMS